MTNCQVSDYNFLNGNLPNGHTAKCNLLNINSLKATHRVAYCQNGSSPNANLRKGNSPNGTFHMATCQRETLILKESV
jgi:hypothetical protein